MIVLTDCLAKQVDEGCMKVANSLVRRMKEVCPETEVLTYGREVGQGDEHMRLNKLFLNPKLVARLRKKKEPVLYIPFSSNTIASVLRTWMLSVFNAKNINVLYALQHPMNRFTKWLLQRSEARIIVLSRQSQDFFCNTVNNETLYLKTGVDTQKFRPVSVTEKTSLRKKYGIGVQEKVVLHVGHLKAGRNVQQLLQIREDYRVLLVVSTKTRLEQDDRLRSQLEMRPNITVIDSFVEEIEEIYQLADIYVFPVQERENCIDVPLSVLEAAACSIPVLSTPYGEVKELIETEGFYEIVSFDPEDINALLDKALAEKRSPRASIEPYDWKTAVQTLLNQI